MKQHREQICNEWASAMKNNGEWQIRAVQMNGTLRSALDFTLEMKAIGRVVIQTHTLLWFFGTL